MSTPDAPTERSLERVAAALYNRIATCNGTPTKDGYCPSCHDDLKLLVEVLPSKYETSFGPASTVQAHTTERPWNGHTPVPSNPTLSELIFEAFNNAAAHGFHDGEDQLPEELVIALKTLLTISEMAEAFEDVRDGKLETRYEHKLPNGNLLTTEEFMRYGRPGKPVGYISELADAVIRIADEIGRRQATDEFLRVLREKLVYNRTRPFKHGKKC